MPLTVNASHRKHFKSGGCLSGCEMPRVPLPENTPAVYEQMDGRVVAPTSESKVAWAFRGLVVAIVAGAVLLILASVTAHCARADGWGHHHVQGAALVRSPYGTFFAAYEMEDFDPQHTPEIKTETLARLTFVPLGAADVKASDSAVDVTLTPTAAGHTIMQWQGWQVELIPADYTERKWVSTFAGNGANMEGADFKKSTVRRRLIIGQHSPDTVSITITDAGGL